MKKNVNYTEICINLPPAGVAQCRNDDNTTATMLLLLLLASAAAMFSVYL